MAMQNDRSTGFELYTGKTLMYYVVYVGTSATHGPVYLIGASTYPELNRAIQSFSHEECVELSLHFTDGIPLPKEVYRNPGRLYLGEWDQLALRSALADIHNHDHPVNVLLRWLQTL